jgi:hypothetical protein
MVPVLEAMGIRMLLNEVVTLERAGETIYLAGPACGACRLQYAALRAYPWGTDLLAWRYPTDVPCALSASVLRWPLALSSLTGL